MSETQVATPTITNAGTKPTTPRKLFVNIPVSDVQRSIIFFEQLGFVFNPQFTDASAAAMLVGAALVCLTVTWAATIGAVLIATRNLLDGVTLPPILAVFHTPAFVVSSLTFTVCSAYPLITGIGVELTYRA